MAYKPDTRCQRRQRPSCTVTIASTFDFLWWSVRKLVKRSTSDFFVPTRKAPCPIPHWDVGSCTNKPFFNFLWPSCLTVSDQMNTADRRHPLFLFDPLCASSSWRFCIEPPIFNLLQLSAKSWWLDRPPWLFLVLPTICIMKTDVLL